MTYALDAFFRLRGLMGASLPASAPVSLAGGGGGGSAFTGDAPEGCESCGSCEMSGCAASLSNPPPTASSGSSLASTILGRPRPSAELQCATRAMRRRLSEKRPM